MKYATVTLLLMTPAFTSVAVSQEGAGHGPPKSSIVATVPTPTTSVPTTGGSLSSFFQPRAELGSMMK